VVNGDVLTVKQVAAFLAERHAGRIEDLEPLGGGWWSSAWGYRFGAEELVVRFGRNMSWYEADQMAMAFTRPGLPVPEVREVGLALDERAYAISVRHHGRFLEDTPVELRAPLASTLTSLLVALYTVPASADSPVLWHPPGAPLISWRQFLLDGLVDDPESASYGWSTTLAADPKLAKLSSGVEERIRSLVDSCPERRDLVHGDLLHGNVLVSLGADRIEAVFSWKCSVRGDFLFDAAWCSFWAPWHAGMVAVDPFSDVIASPAVRADPGALVDAALRHHCYELHIGFTHLGWNIWTGNQTELEATVLRLSEVLERGPLPLLGSPDSAL
jgi:aminoglycoside phosphotransferase (APT) family kinase protein